MPRTKVSGTAYVGKPIDIDPDELWNRLIELLAEANGIVLYLGLPPFVLPERPE